MIAHGHLPQGLEVLSFECDEGGEKDVFSICRKETLTYFPGMPKAVNSIIHLPPPPLDQLIVWCKTMNKSNSVNLYERREKNLIKNKNSRSKLTNLVYSYACKNEKKKSLQPPAHNLLSTGARVCLLIYSLNQKL